MPRPTYQRLPPVEHESDNLVPNDPSDDLTNVSAKYPPRSKWLRFAIPHLLILAAYTCLFLIAFSLPTQTNTDQLLPSPAQAAIQTKRQTLHNSFNATNPYKGPPSPELDGAWHQLLQHSMIRLSTDELSHMGRTSVEFADGSGDHLGGLDVYHQLHCLKYIRQYVHRDYYAELKTNVPKEEHVDHCIDSLRQFLMCRADAGVLTHSWIPGHRKPWASFETEHACVDWEGLDTWASGRSVDMYAEGLLVHPTLGASFPEGRFEAHEVDD